MTDSNPLQVYHSFSRYGTGAPKEKAPGVIYKPRTKGFTALSVQFEDGTEVSDVEVVILATGYNHRFPFLDPSDPYNRPSRELITSGQHAIMTTNASAHSRPEGEQRLTTNLNYIFPLDRQVVSLSSLHPLNALFIIGLPFPGANALNGIAQSMFAGHLIAHPDRVYPTSHITGQEGWNETLAREMLLKNLTTFEKRLAGEGFDIYQLGHMMSFGLYTDAEYQDSLIAHLQTQGLVPPHGGGYIFVEPWRTRVREEASGLRRIWREIESRGEDEVKRWLDGVETEEKWADLIDRLVKWDEEHGIQ